MIKKLEVEIIEEEGVKTSFNDCNEDESIALLLIAMRLFAEKTETSLITVAAKIIEIDSYASSKK